MSAALTLRDVSIRRGTRQLLANVSLDVAGAGIIAIMGPSGSGKTTLLRAVAGLERIDAGAIEVAGVTLTPARPSAATLRTVHRGVGLVFQFHHLFDHLSVTTNVCLAPVHAYGVRPAEAERRARELLTLLDVDHRAAAMPRELSGGEAQRVAIARALAVDPPLLMLDEPTASLDPARRDGLGALLQRLAGQDRTILIATHDEPFARQWGTSMLRIEGGSVVA